jgi:hypothetical protein
MRGVARDAAHRGNLRRAVPPLARIAHTLAPAAARRAGAQARAKVPPMSNAKTRAVKKKHRKHRNRLKQKQRELRAKGKVKGDASAAAPASPPAS